MAARESFFSGLTDAVCLRGVLRYRDGVRTPIIALFWATVAVAFGFAIWPHQIDIPGNPSDKVQHIAAFAVIAALATMAFPRIPPLRIVAGLSAYGALIEFVQWIPALHRDSDICDWVADTAASAIVLLIVWFWRRRANALSNPS